MFLAEIADKTPTLGQCAFFGALLCPIAALAMALGRWRLVLPLLLLIAAFQSSDLWDVSFRAAYMDELGLTYLLSSLSATGVPAILACCLTDRLKRRLLRQGCAVHAALCPTCRYDLRAHAAGSNCPECGAPVRATPPSVVGRASYRCGSWESLAALADAACSRGAELSVAEAHTPARH